MNAQFAQRCCSEVGETLETAWDPMGPQGNNPRGVHTGYLYHRPSELNFASQTQQKQRTSRRKQRKQLSVVVLRSIKH
jgi:hypothetical protein